MINTKSEWLTAEVVANAGLTASAEMIIDRPKDYMGFIILDTVSAYQPGMDWSVSRGHYTDFRFVAGGAPLTQLIMTYDTSIKTMKDLAGKVVDVGRKGASNTPDHLAVLEEYGVLDSVKRIVYTGFGGGKNKMKDGLVDASFIFIEHIYPAEFAKGSLVDEMETRAPIQYIGFDEATLQKLLDAGFGTVPVRIPAFSLDPVTQPNELWALNDPIAVGASADMDEDVVYEVARIIWETPVEEWSKWHRAGANLVGEFKAVNPSPAVWPVHRGAEKYYKEKGITLKSLAEALG